MNHKHKFKMYGLVRDFYGSKMYIFECSVCSVKPLVSKSDLYELFHWPVVLRS